MSSNRKEVNFTQLAEDLVEEFHRVFGHPVRNIPTLIPQNEVDLRAALLLEECGEFVKACAEHDILEMADGLGDMAVVIAGSALVYGFNLPLLVFETPDVSVDLETAVTNATAPFSCLDDQGIALAVAMKATYEEAERRSIPLESCFRAIHVSNMSKLDSGGSVIRRADGKILKGSNFKLPELTPILASAGLLSLT